MLARNCIKNPYIVVIIIAVSLVIGAFAFIGTDVDIYPEMNMPYIGVITTVIGGEKSAIETTRVLDSLLSDTNGVKSREGAAMNNLSVVILNLDESADSAAVAAEVERKLGLAQFSLPAGAGKPAIIQADMYESSLITLALARSGGIAESDEDIRVIADMLRRTKGVAKVEISGYSEKNSYVLIDEINVDAIADEISKQLAPDETDPDYDEAIKNFNEQVDFMTYLAHRAIDGTLVTVLLAAQNLSVGLPPAAINGVEYLIDLDGSIGSHKELLSLPLARIDMRALSDKYRSELEKYANEWLTLSEYDALKMSMGEHGGILDKLFIFNADKSLRKLDLTALDKYLKISGYFTVTVGKIASVAVLDKDVSGGLTLGKSNALKIAIYRDKSVASNVCADNVNDTVAAIKEQFPDFEYETLTDQGRYFEELYDSLFINILLGAALVIIVMTAFMRNAKIITAIAFSIVFSLVTAFGLMYLFGIAVNMFSIAGMLACVGILVDNSIVVSDSIAGHIDKGLKPKDAALRGTADVNSAVLSSTVTTIAVFAPLMLFAGFTRMIVLDVVAAIAFMITSSYFVAVTFIPAVMAHGGVKGRKEGRKLKEAYMRLLERALNKKRAVTVSVAAVLLISTVGLFFFSYEVLPDYDIGNIDISITVNDDKLPQGITPDEAEDIIADNVLRTANTCDYIKNCITYDSITLDGGTKSIKCTLKSQSKLADKTREFYAECLKSVPLPQAAYTLTMSNNEGQSHFKGDSFRLRVMGDGAAQTAAELALAVKERGGTVTADTLSVTPAYKLDIDAVKSMNKGLTRAEAMLAVTSALGGLNADGLIKSEGGSVIVSGAGRNLTRYFITTDNDGVYTRIYVRGDIDINGNYVDDRYFVMTPQGEKEVAAEKNGFAADGKLYVKAVDKLYKELGRNIDDIVTLEISAISYPFTSQSAVMKFQLYEILSDDCFTHDKYGNVIFREDGEVPVGITVNEKYDINRFFNGLSMHEVSVKLGGELDKGKLKSLVKDAKERYPSVTVDITDGGMFGGVMADIAVSLVLAVVVVYAVMAVLFKSWKKPLIVMVTVPLAFIGCILGVLLSGSIISSITLISFILLAGIVVNNGIVFVDCASKMIDEGMPRREAVLRAGGKRFNAIASTCATTVSALIFMIFSKGVFGAVFRTIALTTGLGLLFSTVLTLVLVPILLDTAFFGGKSINKASDKISGVTAGEQDGAVGDGEKDGASPIV